MKYARILMAVASEIWAMHPAKLEAMLAFLALQADGVKFDAREIEAKVSPQTASAVARRDGAVAILPLRGVIANRMNLMTEISGGTSTEMLGTMFTQCVNDDAVKAIILDVDSPGGAVQGTEELASLIQSARGSKPIVAQVNATAASAAYWIASAADEIVVTPTGWVGSIGVMTAHDDISAALEMEGVKRTLIASSEFKVEGHGCLPLSEDARAYMEAQCMTLDAMFVDRIAKGRGIPAAKIRSEFGKGRMVLASQAVSAGMADRVATLTETLARFGAARTSDGPSRRLAARREARALQI